MPRFIEVQHIHECKSPLEIGVGDLLVLPAIGGSLRSGDSIVEVLGPFVTSVVGTTGSVLTPMGAPNRFLVIARRPGMAIIELFTGDPWRASKAASLEILVEQA